MSGLGERRGRIFLLGAGLFFLPLFAIPLFVDPYWWADVFGWDTTPETEVGHYFGRCLGALAIALAVVSLQGSRAPARYRALFDVIVVATALLAVAHLRGFIEDAQPTVEDLEILGYSAVAALAWWSKPSARDPRISHP
ncbi:MAG TPA: hypothetical protein VFB51_14945 [Solirubrobacterales bacterium]|nr:hypothetical protein [Solirubrobacterales bacterium]